MSVRRGPGIVAPTRVGLLVLAAAVLPIVVRECKPLVRRIGIALEDFGKNLRDYAQSPEEGTIVVEAVEIVEEEPEPQTQESPEETPPKQKRTRAQRATS